MNPLASTLLKLAIPLAMIGVLLIVARKRGFALDREIGLRAPKAAHAAAWIAGWIVLVAAEEWLGRWLHLEAAKPWAAASALIVTLRVLAIGIAGPVAEELAFRGVLMAALRRSRLGVPWVIAITALGWALVHFQYEPLTLGLIFFDGLVLGSARVHTGSLWVPIAMHVGGNLYSVGQSLAAW